MHQKVSSDSLLIYIDSGEQNLFFKQWASLASDTNESKVCEVLLMIHFVLYPTNPLFSSQRGYVNIDELTRYLQANSEFISKYPELLVYFALPYIANPVDHPNFCHLFTAKWINSLKNRVLSCICCETTQTVLETLFSQHLPQKKSVFMSHGSSTSNLISVAYVPEMTFAPSEPKFYTHSLNFISICYDLNNLSDEIQICALLQALRWRITKTDPDLSESCLESYIKYNIMCVIKPHDSLLDHLLSSTKKIKEYALRLLNVIAHKKAGRDYLLNKENIIALVLNILYPEKTNNSLRQICLSFLQKLSLRKEGQMCMIQMDMIKWILKVIKNEVPCVDEEMIEFCTAIMMNLSVRSAAKAKFEELQPELLQAITKYLNFHNLNVTKYINCLLYTLLSYESFRISAKKLGIDKLLNHLCSISESELKKQLELILDQLESTEDNNTSLVSDIESDDTYIIIDDDMDDIITNPNVLKGFELLQSKYETKTEGLETASEAIFQSRDKIPRTPYN